jgi:hypothetical protein
VDDAKAANLAIRLIAEAGPAQTASVEISGALSSEQIERMSLSEAIAYAEQLGIEVPTSPEALPAGLPRAATEA